MDPRISIPFILTTLLSALGIACWVIGVALALSRWRRHPRVSLFALLAFSMLFISRFQDVLFPVIIKQNVTPPSPSTFGNESGAQNATL
jgi:hypothetical protein